MTNKKLKEKPYWVISHIINGLEFMCSKCEIPLTTTDLSKEELIDAFKYCPFCGAKMNNKGDN